MAPYVLASRARRTLPWPDVGVDGETKHRRDSMEMPAAGSTVQGSERQGSPQASSSDLCTVPSGCPSMVHPPSTRIGIFTVRRVIEPKQ